LSRLLQLWLQVWLYSVVFGLIGALSGTVSEVTVDTHYFLTILFPVTMGHYWFMTAYVFLYLLLPLAGLAVRNMTREQLKWTVICLLAVFCVSKSVLPVRLEMDGQGYDCIWYLCVFVSAAYLRRFGIPCLERKGRALFLYVLGCLLIFGGTMGLRAFYLHTGSLGTMLTMCIEYNHILPFLAALGLFGFFRCISVKGKITDVIKRIAPHTLGVYLLHENIGLRYSWQKWLGAEQIGGVPSLVLWTVAAAAVVFAAGIAVDRLRAALMRVAGHILEKLPLWRRLKAGILFVDALFGEKTVQ
jgi:surface polysaccharide O-acyltransferase-like enzyme